MKFSVIIPVHNAEKYIEESVLSALGQRLPEQTSIEILLIENGSDDNSAGICDKFAGDNDAVFSFHIGKASAYEARQEGIRKATGEWLIFMDADDKACENLVSDLAEAVDMYDKKGVTPDVILYNAAELDTPKQKMFKFPFLENKVYGPTEKKDFYRLMCCGDSLNAMWNKCLGRDLAYDIVLGDEEMRLNHGEDLLQTAKIIDRAKGIAYLDRILYLYRINEEGLTGSYHPEFINNQARAWEVFDIYADKWCKGEYADIIRQRKSLTCTIGLKKLLYSELQVSDIKRRLKEMMSSGFYIEYAKGELPKWAPEEDVFVHSLQMANNPGRALMFSCRKHKLKSFIKARIRKNGI
ncbi:glycosyltransferase family 2 protein [Butyrivibrio sp. LC3010]|uniref:glycosyltransferase family 2 protein n=1 Tax=unclassified Butyrivibrio TaxID=2639466 RepID=UPI0004793357|nr:glycosyltransferase family 2 protein [Butyrivibrio sp. LC3010]